MGAGYVTCGSERTACPFALNKKTPDFGGMNALWQALVQSGGGERMIFAAFKHLVVGAMLLVFGCFGVNRDAAFVATSVPAQLIVLQVDSERTTEGQFRHRTTLGLVTDARPRPEYAGNMWTGIAMHRAGDIVAGRYDAESGVMRSDRMLTVWGWIARLAQFLGVVAAVQGVLILFGFPESRMPLPVRIGRERRTMFKL
jgi:hypothetical protein